MALKDVARATTMKRYYYISDDLNDLESIERELEDKGFSTPQIHVLSENDAEVEKHHLHAIEAVLKQDVVHSTELGAASESNFMYWTNASSVSTTTRPVDGV